MIRSAIVTACLLALAPLVIAQNDTNPEPPPPPNGSMLDVRDFGARGDGKADDTEAIQKALDAASQRNWKSNEGTRGAVFIPSGRYRITESLVIERTSGLTIAGAGRSNKFGYARSGKDVGTTLVWDGEDKGVLMKIRGSGYITLRDMTLWGEGPSLEGKGKAGTLVRGQSLRGHAMAMCNFVNLNFCRSRVGLEMGGGDGPDMCNSDNFYYTCDFTLCDEGFVTRGVQSVNHFFFQAGGVGTGTVFSVYSGGNIMVKGGSLTNCRRMAHIRTGGVNIGHHSFESIRMERAGKGDWRYQLLKAGGGGTPLVITMKSIGCQANRNPEGALFDLSPGVMVTVTDSIVTHNIADIEGEPKKQSLLTFRNCAFYHDNPEAHIRLKGDGAMAKIEDCFGKSREKGYYLMPDQRLGKGFPK